MTLIREGYNSRKPRTLSSEQIHSFIMQTPDEHSLATKEYHREFPVLLFFLKVTLIMRMRIIEACRAQELHKMQIKDLNL